MTQAAQDRYMTMLDEKSPAQPGPSQVLQVKCKPGETTHQRLAANAYDPAATGLFAAQPWTEKTVGQTGINEALAAVREHTDQAAAGNLDAAKRMLMAQSLVLNAIFTEMTRKASTCISADDEAGKWSVRMESMQATMNVALKAQSQCRATLEALNELVNPRSVAFIKQANLANGPQQINNGATPPSAAAREETPIASNKLLQENPSERLDTRAAQAAGGVDQELASVGAVHRPQDAGRKVRSLPKRPKARAA